MPMKEAVQIQKMIAAAMVMVAAVFSVALIPDILNLMEGSRFRSIHPFYQIGVHLLAVAHSLRLNLQSLVEQIVVTGDDVYEVTDTSGCVV